MRVFQFSLELNKIFLLAFLIAMVVMGFGNFLDILPVIGTYGILLFMNYYSIKYSDSIRFYEWVNVGFVMALNAACWLFYIFTSFVNMSMALYK